MNTFDPNKNDKRTIKPNTKMDVKGLGMPIQGGGFGKLVITFNINFDIELSQTQVEILKGALSHEEQ